MQPGGVQGFICIDITQPCQEGLVQQQWFELAFVLMEHLEKPNICQGGVERLGTEGGQYVLWMIRQPNAPKFTRIIENQALTAIKFEQQAIMLLRFVWDFTIMTCLFHPEIAAHAQVDQQGIL